MNQTETEYTENTVEHGLINARCKQKHMWCPPILGSISAVDRYEMDRTRFTIAVFQIILHGTDLSSTQSYLFGFRRSNVGKERLTCADSIQTRKFASKRDCFFPFCTYLNGGAPHASR